MSKKINGKRKEVYRSSVKGDRNSEVAYHLGDQTDEDTEEEIFRANNNAENKWDKINHIFYGICNAQYEYLCDDISYSVMCKLLLQPSSDKKSQNCAQLQ